MSNRYQFHWDYSDVKAGELPPNPKQFDVHFSFHLIFPDIPPGDGHAAHFAFNVLSPDTAKAEGILGSKRGYLVRESFSHTEITKTVEQTVADAFATQLHEKALEILNTHFIYSELDFSAEFKDDLLEPQQIVEMIDRVFDGIQRGQGITLHEATVLDDYGNDEQREKARMCDQETRWQDIPESTLSKHSGSWMFLDMEGHRYYLPALMSWGIKNDDCHDAYQSVLPLVAPRDRGRGHGDKFDVQDLIEKYSFTAEQVKAIYLFLVFAAIKGGENVEEDYYPAMLKWKKAAEISV